MPKSINRLEKVSFDAYNEANYLIEVIERYKDQIGVYSSRILAQGLPKPGKPQVVQSKRDSIIRSGTRSPTPK